VEKRRQEDGRKRDMECRFERGTERSACRAADTLKRIAGKTHFFVGGKGREGRLRSWRGRFAFNSFVVSRKKKRCPHPAEKKKALFSTVACVAAVLV
jgi:hypothetical protein